MTFDYLENRVRNNYLKLIWLALALFEYKEWVSIFEIPKWLIIGIWLLLFPILHFYKRRLYYFNLVWLGAVGGYILINFFDLLRRVIYLKPLLYFIAFFLLICAAVALTIKIMTQKE